MIGSIIIIFNTRTIDNYSGILRYASYVSQKKEKEEEKRNL